MKYALIFLVGCGSSGVSPCVTDCGLNVTSKSGALYFACSDYQALERNAVQELPVPLCTALRGVTAWEMPGFTTDLGPVKAAGWAECDYQRFFFHTGDGYVLPGDPLPLRLVQQTAFVHEAAHIAQNCDAPRPVDPGLDISHANWGRAGIYDAIDRANRR